MSDTTRLDRNEDESAHRQVVLPFFKSLQIAYKNIRVRFFRSMITTMSLVLAIAFLTFVNVSSDVVNTLLYSGNAQTLQELRNAGYDTDAPDMKMAANAKQRWIIFLSLLVCVVGIVNAQLMAVTERFREIGTMKCLGALDRFILRLFLLEAAIQGIAGAGIGAAAGAGFAFLSAAIRFEFSVVAAVPLMNFTHSIGLSILVGCALSLLGVFYPALVASRMQPVEAMRIEQ